MRVVSMWVPSPPAMPYPDPLAYDLGWSRVERLRDERLVQLRLVRPEDKPLFDEAFEALSPASRYHRFFTGKHHLTGPELRYFTEVDGLTHLALGAATADGSHGVAVGRFVRLEEGVAEPAVTVVDSWQGLGLGALLLEHLRLAALERGYRLFRAQVLSDNAAAMRMMRRAFPGATLLREGSVTLLDCPLAHEALPS